MSDEIEQFDRAWQEFYQLQESRPIPSISEFLPNSLVGGARLELLVCLIEIDQQYRWQPLSSRPEPPERRELHSYAEEWPEIRTRDIIRMLLSSEHDIRPSHDKLSTKSVLSTWDELSGTVSKGATKLELPAPPAGSPILPKHAVIRELGTGGQGDVWLAKRYGGLEEAVKVIKSSDLKDLARFRQEVTALELLHANCPTPSIVRIFESEFETEPNYVALEYCRHGTLQEHLANQAGRTLDARESAKLLKELAKGVAVAHEGCCEAQGAIKRQWTQIVHRDIKPANIFLEVAPGEHLPRLASDSEKRFQPKLGDFGLATLAGTGVGPTMSGDIIGTVAYMSPEQATGESRSVGPGSDIYSLGAVLYQCVAGTPPFNASNQTAGIHQLLHCEPVDPRKLNSEVPRDLAVIITKCLRKEPRKRYGTARELTEDLERFLSGEPIKARPTSMLEKCVKWCRRRPASSALAVSGLLILGLLVAWRVSTANHNAQASRRADAAVDKAIGLSAQAESMVVDSALSAQSAYDTWTRAMEHIQQADRIAELALLEPLTRTRLERERNRIIPQLERFEGYTKFTKALERIEESSFSRGDFSGEEAKGYRDAFKQLGFTEQNGTSDRVEILSSMPQGLRVRTIVTLYDWWMAESSLKGAPGSKAKWLFDSIRTFDKNQFRASLRDAWARGDRPAIHRMLQDKEASSLDIGTLRLFSALLSVTGKQEEATDLLREGWLRYPGSYFIVSALASELRAFADATDDSEIRREAHAFYRVAISLRPDYFRAYSHLGNELGKEGKHDESIKLNQRAIQLRPHDSWLWYNLGIVLWESKEYESAESAFQESSSLDASNVDAWVRFGQAAVHNGRFKTAASAFGEAVLRQPDNAFCHGELGFAQRVLGDDQAAVESYKVAIGLEPGNPFFHSGLGRAYRGIGRFDSALEELATAHKLRSRSSGWDIPTERWLEEVQTYLRIESELKKGNVDLESIDTSSLVDYARCFYHLKRYRASVGCYDRLLSEVGQDQDSIRPRDHWYNAACAAALSGAGRGIDAPKEESTKKSLRTKAFDWLSKELAIMERSSAGSDQDVVAHMRHWKSDYDLACIRDPILTGELSSAEQEEVLVLWHRVESLLVKCRTRLNSNARPE